MHENGREQRKDQRERRMQEELWQQNSFLKTGLDELIDNIDKKVMQCEGLEA